MIAHRREVSVIGGSFLISMYRAFRIVHVQYHSLVRCPRHCLAYPLSIQLLQAFQVLPSDKHFGINLDSLLSTLLVADYYALSSYFSVLYLGQNSHLFCDGELCQR